MKIYDTRYAQWWSHCPTYAALAESGRCKAPGVVYERSLNFALARYMTLKTRRREHSIPLLTRLMGSLMKGQPQPLLSKALRALDNLTYTVSMLALNDIGHKGTLKKVAGFNLPILYVGGGHPIYLNIDLLLTDTPMKNIEAKDYRHGSGVRIIIYHYDPDREPSRTWLLHNPRVVGAVCLAGDLMSSYDMAVDVLSPWRRSLYRIDLREDYITECREHLHYLGRQISDGILGKIATEACHVCALRKECEGRGASRGVNVRTVSKVSI